MTFVICWGWSKDPGPTNGGEVPRHFLVGSDSMTELSIFIDESGDFGPYEYHSPFYVLTMVFHDQAVDISPNLQRLHDAMSSRGLPDYTVHAGPLIRRDNEYRNLLIEERKRILDCLFYFVRTIDIKYHTIIIEKKQLNEDIELVFRISKQLSVFLSEHLRTLMKYDRIIVYYDYGQRELAKILITAFNTALNNVEIKKVVPANYKLFQVADMICTFELLAEKATRKILSNSELNFFTSERRLKKTYLRTLIKKRYR